MNEEIRACRCTDFWAFHHPDCPAMQTIRRLRDELAECREFYAVTAWNHYMETCKKRGVSPAEHGHWSSAGAIRKAALAAKE